MPDGLVKPQSPKKRNRKNRERTGSDAPQSDFFPRIREIGAYLPEELREPVRNLFRNRAELEKENRRLRKSHDALESSHKYSLRLLNAASASLLALNRKGIILESNLAFAALLGRKPPELIGRRFASCLHPDDVSAYRSHVRRLWREGDPQSSEIRLLDGKDVPVYVRMDSVLSKGRVSGSIHLATITGIAQQREAAVKQDLAADVLRELNRGSGDITLLIREVLHLIIRATGFGAVGLRLRQGDDFPYYEQHGFSDDFLYRENFVCGKDKDGSVLRDENNLPILECTCGLVLSGRTPPSASFFTEGGSFWTNKASELLALATEEDPRINPRNQCIHNGYQSVALIPVRSGREIIGLLQLNDRRENRLSRELVRFFEGLGDQIGLTLQRKQAEDALRQKQLDLSRAQAVGQIGSWRLDVEHNILTWSDENHRIFGIPKGTPMTYETFLATVHEEDRRYVDTAWKAALKGEPYDIEHRIRADGAVKWVREKAYLEFDSDGNLWGGFGITQDITRSKQAEEELKDLNESLERRVKERSAVAEFRAEQLQRLTLELTLAEQRERQRLAMVLHDGLQQILVGAKIQLAFVERSQDIHSAVDQVTELIDDAIETSRSLTAELSPPILLQGDLVLAFEWLVRWVHRKYGLNVRLVVRGKIKPLEEEINLLFFQAVRELLFNVVKHSGVKDVTVRVRENNGRIETIVEDKGRGFDPAGLRAEGGRAEGTGLFGIRERISYFGGWMEIDSNPGVGSRFKLILPKSIIPAKPGNFRKIQARPEESLDSRTGSKPVDRSKKIRVFLADDHVVMRQGLSRLLRGEPDMEIVGEASNGESAIGLARELRPDVVLMDVNMPGLGGIDAARILHKEYPDIRIIGLSMFQEDERSKAMKKAGAVEYIAKSGPSDAVLKAIRKCAGTARKRSKKIRKSAQ
jgi:PAS domain S-box-containing protein